MADKIKVHVSFDVLVSREAYAMNDGIMLTETIRTMTQQSAEHGALYQLQRLDVLHPDQVIE